MRAFTIGDRTAVRAVLTLDGVEAVKWFALGLMLIEHVHRYVLGSFPLWVYLSGRAVFPLFALALGVVLADGWGTPRIRRTLERLAIWCLIAAALRSLVLPALPVNVLLTLALGVFAYASFRDGGRRGLVVALLAVAFGALAEFGPWGVIAVMCACAYGERGGFGPLVGCIASVCVSQWTLAPVLAVPIAIGVGGSFVVPRVRQAFYWAYALQWPLLAGAAWIVGR